ncbi:MAG: hypothetical protein ACRDA5_02370 [Clostridium sp.]
MIKLSNGMDSTLGNYRDLAFIYGGSINYNNAMKFLDEKIKNSPNGRDEEVIADERQMKMLIVSLIEQGLKRE